MVERKAVLWTVAWVAPHGQLSSAGLNGAEGLRKKAELHIDSLFMYEKLSKGRDFQSE